MNACIFWVPKNGSADPLCTEMAPGVLVHNIRAQERPFRWRAPVKGMVRTRAAHSGSLLDHSLRTRSDRTVTACSSLVLVTLLLTCLTCRSRTLCMLDMQIHITYTLTQVAMRRSRTLSTNLRKSGSACMRDQCIRAYVGRRVHATTCLATAWYACCPLRC